MPDLAHLRARLAALFSTALNVEVPSADTDLFETGVLDSLAFVDLLLHLERDFGVTASVDELEAENFRSIGHIAAFLLSRGPAAAAVALEPPTAEPDVCPVAS
jgi:D-alanine--poly(phosphoribitol) ligase subunit 2